MTGQEMFDKLAAMTPEQRALPLIANGPDGIGFSFVTNMEIETVGVYLYKGFVGSRTRYRGKREQITLEASYYKD